MNGSARPVHRSEALDKAMARALAPIYTRADTAGAYAWARAKVKEEIDDGYLRIARINPSPDSFADFGVSTKVGEPSRNVRVIPNDNLIYRGLSRGQTPSRPSRTPTC